MLTLFGLCAVVGGTVLVCQFLLTLSGLGGDSDGGTVDSADVDGADVGGIDVSEADVTDLADDVPSDGGHPAGETESHSGHGHGAAWFFRVVSFRTVIAALTFFGLSGLAANANGASPSRTFSIAVAAGLAAMFAVHWIMQLLFQLRTDGTVSVQDAVGLEGVVHVRIPGGAVAGKILMNLSNRTMEFAARSSTPIPSGETVVVRRVTGPDMVEVELVSREERASRG